MFAHFECELRVEAAKHFFAAFWVHGRKFAHKLVARFHFRVTTPADADREQRGYYPNGNLSFGHEGKNEAIIKKVKRKTEVRGQTSEVRSWRSAAAKILYRLG